MAPPGPQGRQNPFLATLAPAAKSFGPFQVLSYSKATPVVTFPYRDVHGGNLIISVVNQQLPAIFAGGLTALTAEVEIVGLIQGVVSILKRQPTRQFTGPITYRFEAWDLYDTIEIRARNMSGGNPGPGTGVTTAAGFALALSVALQPNIVLGGKYGRPMVNG